MSELFFSKKKKLVYGLRIKHGLKSGDIVRVSYNNEGRELFFIGRCISIKFNGFNSLIILRNVFGGVGVERKFNLGSIKIMSIKRYPKVVKKFRRGKLYFYRRKALRFSLIKI